MRRGRPTVSLIFAADENWGIGSNNSIPWHLPDEFQHFKLCTLNKPIVMGRKTFESLGSKPLPNRLNIVMTRDTEFEADGVYVANDKEAVYGVCENETEIMIIGGRKIYEEFLPVADRLYITFVRGQYLCDTYFNPNMVHGHWDKIFDKLTPKWNACIFNRK